MSQAQSAVLPQTSVEQLGEAWLLHLSQHLCVAVGRYELKYLETDYELIQVPGAPDYCNRCIHWQGQLIPLLEAVQLLQDFVSSKSSLASEVSGLAIVAYELQGGGDSQGMGLGALAVTRPPTLVGISAEQALDLQALPPRLRQHSRACFTYQGQSLGCLNLGHLFSPFHGF
ncbi:hypothetical protein R50073_28900 [Maricurvus nonylphenolicus]|uniref:hypothetical protein n=1 Tax=Maricurvus nonylphenolicus TaxID=1008307 RepID=UPI0036F2572B